MKAKIDLSARKPVGIWIRVSTEDQAQGDSPEHHEQRARCYAESKGWEILEVYHLEGVSGKAVLAHRETKRMLADVKKQRITGLIFSKLARLARNTRELLDFADRFREADADLVSLQEAIDTSSPAGRLFYTMIAAMAQWEREEIADRVAASIGIRAKLGKQLNGKASYGYQWKDKRLVPHPDEAPVRKLIHDLFLEHRRKKLIARQLNERGYRTRDGNLWSDTTIHRLLLDPTAKGTHRANYTTQTIDNPRLIKPEDDWVWTAVEPIVSEEVWDRCNQILTDRKAKAVRVGRRPVHLFAGLTRCHCGGKMYVPSDTPKYVCQECRNKIPIIDLEAIFCEQLREFFLSPAEVADHLQRADEHLTERQSLLDGLYATREEVGREAQRAYKLYIDEKIDGEGFNQFYKPLQERQRQLDEEIPSRQAEVDLLRVNHLSADHVPTEASDLHARWPALSREEKQGIVESITESIVIGKDEIHINLCHLPSSEKVTTEQRKLTPAAVTPAAPPAASNSSPASPTP